LGSHVGKYTNPLKFDFEYSCQLKSGGFRELNDRITLNEPLSWQFQVSKSRHYPTPYRHVLKHFEQFLNCNAAMKQQVSSNFGKLWGFSVIETA